MQVYTTTISADMQSRRRAYTQLTHVIFDTQTLICQANALVNSAIAAYQPIYFWKNTFFMVLNAIINASLTN